MPAARVPRSEGLTSSSLSPSLPEWRCCGQETAGWSAPDDPAAEPPAWGDMASAPDHVASPKTPPAACATTPADAAWVPAWVPTAGRMRGLRRFDGDCGSGTLLSRAAVIVWGREPLADVSPVATGRHAVEGVPLAVPPRRRGSVDDSLLLAIPRAVSKSWSRSKLLDNLESCPATCCDTSGLFCKLSRSDIMETCISGSSKLVDQRLRGWSAVDRGDGFADPRGRVWARPGVKAESARDDHSSDARIIVKPLAAAPDGPTG